MGRKYTVEEKTAYMDDYLERCRKEPGVTKRSYAAGQGLPAETFCKWFRQKWTGGRYGSPEADGGPAMVRVGSARIVPRPQEQVSVTYRGALITMPASQLPVLIRSLDGNMG